MTASLLTALVALGADRAAADWLYVTEGNNVRRIDLATLEGGPPVSELFIEHAPRAASEDGRGDRSDHAHPMRRDVNGMLCALPGGRGAFVAGEDTGQPSPLPGWGIFDADGKTIGKLTTTAFVEQAEPYGCALDSHGVLFTSELGNVGFGRPLGQLVQWFPPYAHFPGPMGAYPETDATSTNACKLATDIGNAVGLAIDADDRVYVASAGRAAIYRFSPPFPTGPTAAGGCGRYDESDAPLADAVQRDVFFRGLYTFSGLAFSAGGNLYAGSVFTGEILEIAPDGTLVRKLLEPDGWLPPFASGNPMGLAVDRAGDLYYADIDLVWDGLDIGPGPNGKVRRIRFDAEGEPQPPEVVLDGLQFPDGLGIMRVDARPDRAAPSR